jgi:hypothetical protein
MKTVTLISFLLFLFVTSSPLVGDAQTTGSGWQWVESAGGTGRDEAELPAIDPFGNVFVCGKFSGTAWFGTASVVSMGNRDAYISKYDATGTLLWVRTIGCAGHAEAISVAADHLGNVAITGHHYGTAHFDTLVSLPGDPAVSSGFLAMYSPAGDLLWAVNTSGGYTRSNGVAFDRQGNIFTTGRYEDSTWFGPFVLHSPGDQNVFLAKHDAAGSIMWIADGGGPSRAWASSVSTDSHGNAYLTGAIRDTAMFGASMLISNGGDDIFLARCSPSGIWDWAVNAGGTGDDFGNGIEVDVFDHIAITGSFFGTATFPPLPPITSYGGRDGYVAYFDPSGACLWANPFGGTSTDKGIGVTTDEIGNVYVSGYINGIGNFGFFQKASAGGDDISIAKYTSTGMVMWAELAGGSGNEYGKGIRALTQGQLYVTGYFEGSANFGTHNVTSLGDRESYVARFWDGTPIITSQPLSQNLCVGDTLMLEIVLADTSGISFSWFKDGNVIPGANQPALAIVCNDTLPTGKYTAIAQTISGYVVSDTAYVNVDYYPVITFNPPEPTIVVSYSGPPMTLDAGAGYHQYLWSTGDTTPSITYTAVDLYGIFQGHHWGYLSVTVSSQHGCTATDSVQVFIANSVEELKDAAPQITLYPNPANVDMVTIDGDNPIRKVEVFTSRGELVMVHETGSSSTNQVQLSVRQLTPGIYFVRIDTRNTTLVRKLVMQ